MNAFNKKNNTDNNKNSRPAKGRPSSKDSGRGSSKRDDDKKSFGKTDDKRSGGYKRGSEGSEKREVRSKDNFPPRGDDKKSFGRSDDKRSGGFKRDAEGGEKRETRSRDNFAPRGDDKKSFGRSDDKRSGGYKRDSEGGEKREFRSRDNFAPRGDDKKSFGRSDDKRSGGYKRDGEGGEKRESKSRDNFAPRGDDKKSFGRSDDKRSGGYKRDGESGEKRTTRGKEGFERTGGEGRDTEKKPFDKFRGKPRPAPKVDEKGEFQNRGYSKKKILEFNKKQKTEGMIRLNKYIANSGICSRREADIHIEAGMVSINGKVITELGYQVAQGDVVKYNGGVIRTEKNVYVLLNKPKDYITTMDDPGGRKTVMELIQHACRERVYPVGRLDRNTTGLLLFTNDGDLAKKLTHPKHGIKKIYHVETDAPVKKSDMEKMLKGVDLEDFSVKADEVSYVGEAKNEVGIMLHSGQNRVVRRMFEHFDYKVVKLDRVYFAGLTKKNLPRGKFRLLNDKEVAMLKMIP